MALEPLGPIKYGKNYKNTLPEGGIEGQVITKLSSDDYHVGWSDVTGSTGSSGIGEEFETVSKNLKSYPYVITYGVDGIDTITYDLGGGLSVVKTFNYTLSVLTSIVLSGDTPSGIELTKTLNYTGVDLTSVSYT